MAELTLEEAREIYKYDELKAMMLGKFSKEELEKDMQYADSGIEKLPSIQVKMKYDIVHNMMNGLSEYAFYTDFADLFKKCGCPVFLDENSKPTTIPTNRIAYMDSSNTWLLDIKYTGNPPHFYVSKSRVFSAFAKKYNMNSEELRRYIDKFAEIKFGIYGSVCIF
jgi:hypothetical protein